MINRFFAHCIRLRIALWWAALSVLLWAHPAFAATRTVDTLVDNAGLTACTAAANDCSLRGALSGASANDTINFAPSLANQTVTLTLDELAINQPVTLDGSTAPTVTISGNNASRVINASQPLTVTRLIIQNGLATNANGGGIYANSNLWLIDSVIRNNVAESGGGAYVVGAASVTGTTFLSNTAQQRGGGAYVVGAVSVTGTSFRNNIADSGGGAYVVGAASITGTSFLSNTAQLFGGGAYVGRAASITGTTFFSNTAGQWGGGVASDFAVSITESSFHRNTATVGGGAYVGHKTSITGTTFLSNTAQLFGGGMFVNGGASITGTSFLSNTANNAGGGVVMLDAAHIINTIFRGNIAVADAGGGAYVGRAASIRGATFLNNRAGNAGGGVVVGNAASITGTSFLSNTAAVNGGGAVISGTASITGTSFLNNAALTGWGGGLFAVMAVTTTGSTFAENVALDGAGLNGESDVTVQRTRFIHNQASNIGGGLYADHGVVQVINSLFARNQATTDGAAIYLDMNTQTASLLHNSIASPTLVASSAIALHGGDVMVANSIIASHTVAIRNSGANALEDYNLFFANLANGGAVSQGHSLTGDPAFVDLANDDYHLTPASAAINLATTSAVRDDFDGASRPQSIAPDMGAFESPYGLPSLSIGDASVVEGNNGTVTLIFPVTLSFAKGITVTAQYNTSDNSALAGSDYQPVNSTLVFAPGVTSQSINVVINADLVVERDETFNVNLSNPVNTTLGKANGVGAITNNDVAALTISDGQRTEGNSGATSFVFTVTLSNPSALSITVSYATSDGSATLADSDYTAASGTLIIAPNIVSQPITVNVVGDTSFESDETFTLTLSNPLGATLADGVATGTIVNDDAAPTALEDADEPTALPAHAYLPLVTR